MAKENAQSRYDKKNRTLIAVMLNRKYDEDILNRVQKESNKQGFIKSLIREKIKEEGQKPLQESADHVENGEN